MKKMKKFLSIILTVVMVLAMAAPAFAATITIDKGASGSTYVAYKLLNATNSADNKQNFAYTVNSKYADVLRTITGKTTDADIVDYISKLTTEESIRTFADKVYSSVETMGEDVTATNNQFVDVAQGYYLIVEKMTPTGDDKDTYSLVMLDTAGLDDVTVETKEDYPEMNKKVLEWNDTSETYAEDAWQDAADYPTRTNANVVKFMLTGDVSGKYDNYTDGYKYVFHDTLATGLTFNEDSVVVKVDGVELETGYEVKTKTAVNDGCTFEVVFANLKDISAVKKNSIITVEYSATLNENAVIGGTGNSNTAYLQYTKNPYKGDELGRTTNDKVIVFTYKTVVNKIDKEQRPLEGAGFTLYKKDANGDYIQIGTELKGDNMTTFTFSGLDAGGYKIVETTIPDGYNKAADIIFEIKSEYDTEADNPKLTSLIVNGEDGNELVDIVKNEITGEETQVKVFNYNVNEGSVTTNVVNTTGTELPSTGGIGTTIFYLAGIILMAGAVFFVIRSRKNSSEN